MLSHFDVIDFFHNHDLIPGDETMISNHEYVSIRFDSYVLGADFDAFVAEIIAPAAYHQFYLNAESWEELYNLYTSFMAGYKGNKA